MPQGQEATTVARSGPARTTRHPARLTLLPKVQHALLIWFAMTMHRLYDGALDDPLPDAWIAPRRSPSHT